VKVRFPFLPVTVGAAMEIVPPGDANNSVFVVDNGGCKLLSLGEPDRFTELVGHSNRVVARGVVPASSLDFWCCPILTSSRVRSAGERKVAVTA
jgi:hypothetical protein